MYLEIRAIDRGTDKVSSQRFSYFGSLAMGEEGDDGACAEYMRISKYSLQNNIVQKTWIFISGSARLRKEYIVIKLRNFSFLNFVDLITQEFSREIKAFTKKAMLSILTIYVI